MRYFFIDQLIEMVPGSYARAKKNITISEEVFRDHFPSLPIYPGALLIEAMSQVSGLLIVETVKERDGREVLPVIITVKKAKFRNIVLPGDTLIIKVNLDNVTDDAALAKASVDCEDEQRASADLFFTLVDVEKTLPGITCPEIANVRKALSLLNDFRLSQKQGL
jgi:3-hydroxyacyl-[acyl-carrier-protein] dehydratase